MTELDGTRALVTGATSGLGLAMAQALVDAGAVSPSRAATPSARRVPRPISARPRSVSRSMSATSVPSPPEWRRLRSVSDGIDLLVNNAGIGMRTVNPRFLANPQPFWDVPPEGFRDVLETKVTGCFLMASAVVPLMLEQGGGRIVMISMNEATMVRRGFVPYGPSGAAVEALARVMAADLADTSGDGQPVAPRRRHRHRDGSRRHARRGARTAARSRDHGTADRVARVAGGGRVHDERIVATEFEQWLATR